MIALGSTHSLRIHFFRPRPETKHTTGTCPHSPGPQKHTAKRLWLHREVSGIPRAALRNNDPNEKGGAMAQKKETEEKKEKPVFERQFGNIHVSVWRNEKENGAVWYNTTIVRKYHDGNKWQDATSFSRDDLPTVVIAACTAYFWIWSQQSVVREEQEMAA
jgi:hypothetical protein